MLPLHGIRVLAFEQYGAGPFGTQYLADMGAEVIKIEQATGDGDYARALGPYFINGSADDSTSSLFFQSLNRNKRSVAFDLNSEDGREILGRLVASADATADNLRGDVPEKLGLTYADLREYNPRIICAHCSAYGREGSRKHWPGYDYLMQAEAGYFALCGEPDAAPTRFGLSIIDYMGGLSMAFALVSGVLNARQYGEGRDMDVNLFDTAVFNLNYLGAWALNSDYEPNRQPRSAHPSLVPCQLYKTADGWIYLICNKESFWPTLCELMERPDLAADARYQNFAGRLEHREALTAIIDEALQARTTDGWLEVFEARVPAAPVLSPRDAMQTEFFNERARVQSLTHASGQPFSLLSPPIDSGDARDEDTGAPSLGEHTDEVLTGLGYADDELAALRARGVIR